MTALALSPKHRTAALATLLAAAMVGLGFASVPLYRLFCQVTGLGGTTQRALAAPGGVAGKTISVRFDANHDPSLPWSFAPERRLETVTVGAREVAFYTATNHSTVPVTGSATYNVTPAQAGGYFSKIQCFCFNEQTLQPGETVRMPVYFFVDPKITTDPDTDDVRQITLSYTFYPVDAPAKAG